MLPNDPNADQGAPAAPVAAAGGQDRTATDNQADGESQVSPEEQDQYNKVMTIALAMLHGDQASHANVVQRLKAAQGGNLAQELGHMAAMILKSAQGNAEQNGVTVASNVLYNAGLEVVAELVDIAKAMGLVKDDKEAEQLFKDGCFQAVKFFGEAMQKEGRITPDVQAAAKQTIQDQAAQEKGSQPPSGIVSNAMQDQGANNG